MSSFGVEKWRCTHTILTAVFEGNLRSGQTLALITNSRKLPAHSSVFTVNGRGRCPAGQFHSRHRHLTRRSVCSPVRHQPTGNACFFSLSLGRQDEKASNPDLWLPDHVTGLDVHTVHYGHGLLEDQPAGGTGRLLHHQGGLVLVQPVEGLLHWLHRRHQLQGLPSALVRHP